MLLVRSREQQVAEKPYGGSTCIDRTIKLPKTLGTRNNFCCLACTDIFMEYIYCPFLFKSIGSANLDLTDIQEFPTISWTDEFWNPESKAYKNFTELISAPVRRMTSIKYQFTIIVNNNTNNNNFSCHRFV